MLLFDGRLQRALHPGQEPLGLFFFATGQAETDGCNGDGILPAGQLSSLGDNSAATADGTYTISVVAKAAGASVSASALTYASVASVSQGSAGVSLDLGAGRKANLTDVKLIL